MSDKAVCLSAGSQMDHHMRQLVGLVGQQRSSMSHYLYALQHTGRPYGGSIPEDAWSEVSRHTSIGVAFKALRRAYRDMAQACGQGAWDDHYRVVALRSHTVQFANVCAGWIDSDGDLRHCDAVAQTTAIWEAGEPAPKQPTPDGWAWPDQCGACARKANEVEEVWNERTAVSG